MSNPPARTPAECLATIILWLSRTVDSHSMWGKLARPLAVLILDRIRAIKQRFDRLAARIEAGRSRRAAPSATPRARLPGGPAPQIRCPKASPGSSSWCRNGGLRLAIADTCSRQTEMAALMQAAPAEMRRVLRPLCHMLGVRPPPILAPPPSARPKPPSPPALAEPAKPPPPAGSGKSRKNPATSSASATPPVPDRPVPDPSGTEPLGRCRAPGS